MEPDQIREQVNQRYGSVVQSKTGLHEQTVAKAFGYTEEELRALPEGANLGLSCGNPFPLANLKEGETVVDLGSGAGFDVFSASKRVGSTGKAIGVDMNKNMIATANANKARTDASNVQFVESAITAVPLPDQVADCIISNCVINLVPAQEKQLAFNEMFRLLKPGGRLAISDILARKEFTEEIRNNIALHVGCVAGASQVSEYDAFLRQAGFRDILIVDNKHDLNVYFNTEDNEPTSKCCTRDEPRPKDESSTSAQSPPSQQQTGALPQEARRLASGMVIEDLNEWAGSFQVYAVKPAATEE